MRGASKRLRATLDSLPAGVVAVDAKARVELWSAEASRLLGASQEANEGRPLASCLPAGHPVLSVLAAVLETGRGVARDDCTLPRPGGEADFTVDLSAAPIGLGGREDGAVVTLHDRTIGRELAALVDQRARSDVHARLAAGIAHEIRNPLAGIHGAAELLESKLVDERLARYPRLIREETARVRRLLDELAELTHGGDVRLRKTNLHRVLDQTLELHVRLPTHPGIEVRREYDPSLPELELDPDRMTQVFLNVARNAVDAMQGAGRLLIRTRLDPLYQLSSAGERHRHMVRVDFEDTGPGIADEDLPHVFTPFFTRKGTGTGLGLAIAEQWVVRHGGGIEIARAHAGGTRVRILLPFSGSLERSGA